MSASRRVYLLAYPAGHSLSPAMQQAAFDHLGIDASYRALAVAPEALAGTVARLREDEAWLGANVTVPHKRAIMPLLDEVTAQALSIGAVNTVVREGQRLVGSNTDAVGFSRALAELWPAPGERNGARAHLRGAGRALLLGAGGSARAVAWALLEAGFEVGVHARRPEASAEMVAELVARRPNEGWVGGPVIVPLGEVPEWAGSCRLLVNATPAGMAGGPAPGAVALSAPLSLLCADAAVVDLVYRPAVTPLLAAAAELGLTRQNGLPMLVWQGAESFSRWTARPAPVEVMRAAAESALRESTPGRGQH